MPRSIRLLWVCLVAFALNTCGPATPTEKETPPAPVRQPVPELPPLTAASASNFAQLTLKCVQKKYPNQPALILKAPEDVLPPEKAHPAFYGCYDWHSAVHGHWMLARLLRLFPALPEASQIKKALTENLSPKNISVEAAYFNRPDTKAFERTYGWAWTLKLAEELRLGTSPEAQAWMTNVKPLPIRWRLAISISCRSRSIPFVPASTRTPRSGSRSHSTTQTWSATSS